MYLRDFHHPHVGHQLNIAPHSTVNTPCCSRKVRADRVYDLRMVPVEQRPLVYGPTDFMCEDCINHSVLNLRQTTYGQLARLLQAPQEQINAYDALDRGIEFNRNQ